MKNLKTFTEFISEASSTAALNFIASSERNKKNINQDRKTPPNQKDQKFQDKTRKQAQVRTDEIDKELDKVGQNQELANKRMEDIKLKQDLLPEDKTKRQQFLDDVENDLGGVKSDLDNASKQRQILQNQKDRIQKNFIKK